MPAGAPLVDGGFAQPGGGPGSLRLALYLGRVGGRLLCVISQALGASSKPQNTFSTCFLVPAVSLIGGQLSVPDLEKKLADFSVSEPTPI